jgi:hypothetical protein
VIKGYQVMRRSEQHEPSRNGAPHGTLRGTSLATWLMLMMATAIMMIFYLSIVLVLQLDAFRPKVGDIVVFRPLSQNSIISQMTVPASATRFHGAECSLDPNVIAEEGGSMIVEARQDEPSLLYRVHWGGSKTALASSDCGGSADLLMSRADLQKLANAAGGFGVGDKRIAQ